jgi:hypothetical protein
MRDARIGEAGALCRPGRTQEKREGVSEGVSDPALALFGPLRAGSLTPTCLVSVVLDEAARMCGRHRGRIRTQFDAKVRPLARRTTS